MRREKRGEREQEQQNEERSSIVFRIGTWIVWKRTRKREGKEESKGAREKTNVCMLLFWQNSIINMGM